MVEVFSLQPTLPPPPPISINQRIYIQWDEKQLDAKEAREAPTRKEEEEEESSLLYNIGKASKPDLDLLVPAARGLKATSPSSFSFIHWGYTWKSMSAKGEMVNESFVMASSYKNSQKLPTSNFVLLSRFNSDGSLGCSSRYDKKSCLLYFLESPYLTYFVFAIFLLTVGLLE